MVERERQRASSETTRPTEGLEDPADDPGRADGLPIAPERPEAAAGTATSEALRQLLRFEAVGQRPADSRGDPGEAWPALLHGYRELAHIRHDFPLVQSADPAGEPARPLSEHIDELLARVGAEGDDAERLKRHVYRLEAEIRALSATRAGAALTELWDQAAAALLARPGLRAKDKQLLQTNLVLGRQALAQDGSVLACDADLPGRLLSASLAAHWTSRCARWREELGALISGLKDLLRADFDRSPAAKTAEHLRESAATANDVDFDAMSSILSGVQLGERLSPARRQRITAALSTLLDVQPLFGENLQLEQPFALTPIRDDLGAALAAHAERRQLMTGFFRAVQIARLELENRYREDTHDELFARFDDSLLDDDERALCPPVVAHLSPDYLATTGIGAVLEAAASGAPLKLLVEVDDLCPAGLREPPGGAGTARLASMASALHDAYVLQAPVSRPMLLQTGFREGLAYPGPALFSVYTGGRHARLPTYLDAEAAMESRAFPAWRYNPGRGETQLERADLRENTQADHAWPVETFRYRTASGEQEATELAFTLADFLYCDQRLAAHFWSPDPGLWHGQMLPLQDYLALDAGAAAERIPYLTSVDAEGRIMRVVMSARLLSSVAELARRWRAQQESGGINNSFALKLLAEEAQRLAEEKAAEVAAIEARYAGKLEQDIGALTREIVGRIAAQLTGGAAGAVPLVPAAPPTAPAAPAATPPAGEADAPAEPPATDADDDEPLSFDDPYIETPLCTSCNDCTNQYPHLFAYDENKQAYIKDPKAGTFRELVLSAELCPVGIIHPGKPGNADEPNLDEWVKRAARFN